MRGYKLNKDVMINKMGELDWTAKELSDHSGIDIQTLYGVLRLNRNVYLKTANKIANALGVKVTELINI